MMNQFQSNRLAAQHRQQLQLEAEQRLAQAAADATGPSLAQPTPGDSLLHVLARVLLAILRPAASPRPVSPT